MVGQSQVLRECDEETALRQCRDVLLTNGENTPDAQYDWVSFCKR